MADETLEHDSPHAAPAAAPVAVPAPAQFSDSEVAELRRRLHEPQDHGGNRFAWFLIGFVAALLSITVAAVVFLAVSDEDDDGNINLDVPSVDVEG